MIRLFRVNMPKTVEKPLLETLFSGYVTEGPKVKEFERLLGEYIDNPNVLAVNSGTSALTLALRLAGVRPGNEVITTPMTCTATNLPILNLFAVPVFADVDPITGNIDPDSVEELITPNTKAIMCVDWGGLPCKLDKLMDIAKRHKLKLIEDAAHAFGASFKDKKVGSVADFTCFSFQAIKHITTIDGGAIACLNEEDYSRGKRLRWFGIDRDIKTADARVDVDIPEDGYKFHMNDVAATIGIEQLKHFDLKRVTEIADTYKDELDEWFLPALPDLPTDFNYRSSFWLFTILLPEYASTEHFRGFMAARDIQVSKVHGRNDQYEIFRKRGRSEGIGLGLPSFYNRMICLPIHDQLSDTDVQKVIAACNEYADKFK